MDKEPLNWWESKRLLYNLALLVGAFFAYSAISARLVEFDKSTLVVWIFGANVFYTVSWAFEFLYYKIFKDFPFSNFARLIIFILGSLFSILWTYLGIQSWHYILEM